MEFQSTPPVRGATPETTCRPLSRSYFNPRSPCGERRGSGGRGRGRGGISIHAPHAGSDLWVCLGLPLSRGFQSTLPMRGATYDGHNGLQRGQISIHAPHAGSDCLRCLCYLCRSMDFNPRSPCGERRYPAQMQQPNIGISIHAPRAGGDRVVIVRVRYVDDISIHAPRAGCDIRGVKSLLPEGISIHAPRAGGDRSRTEWEALIHISIHAPRAGGDQNGLLPTTPRANFNPRSPCGGRRDVCGLLGQFYVISIHAPRAGGDSGVRSPNLKPGIFQSTLPVRGATARQA